MIRICLFFTLLFYTALSYAVTYDWKGMALDVNGYVGYQYVNSTAPNHDVVSEPELGVSGSLQITDNLSAYTQFTYSKNNLDDAMVYSFMSYDSKLSDSVGIGIKAGRLRHDYALYNEVRVNPRTRPGIIMPQSIYWDSLKFLLISGDGINFNTSIKNLELGYTLDKPEIVNNIAEAKVWSPLLLNSVSSYFGSHQLATAKYTFTDIPLVLKSSWTWLDLGNDNTKYVAMLFPGKGNDHQVVQLWNNGFISKIDDFTLSGEVLMVKPFVADWFNSNETNFGVSVTGRYEVTEHISMYTNYNEYNSAKRYNGTKPAHLTGAKDINFGINYHEKDWMVGAEIHHVNGSRWLNPGDTNNNPDAYKEWYMIGINAAYFF